MTEPEPTGHCVCGAVRYRALGCGRCGTPLTHEGARWSGEVHVLVGTLDRPEDFAPTRNAFAEEQLPWPHLAAPGSDAG